MTATQSIQAPPTLTPTVVKTQLAKPTNDPTKTATHNLGAAFTIKRLSAPTIQYLNILLYGVPGSGKTSLAGSAADVDEMSDVLVVDIEAGDLAMLNNPLIERIDRIDSIRATSYKQLGEIHKFLKAHCRLRDLTTPEAEEGLRKLEARFLGCDEKDILVPRRYRTAIIDSLSELDTMVINEILGIKANMDFDKLLTDGEVEVAQFTEYKKNNQVMNLLVKSFRDLPISCIFTCHSMMDQDELKRMYYSPALTGKLRTQLTGYMDITGFLQVGTVPEGQKLAPRILAVHPVGKFTAKCRIASFKESTIVHPTMKKIWAILKNSATKAG